MSIIEEVCCVKGHNLQSQVTGQIVEPLSKVVINKYDQRCTQCGRTIEEALKYRVGGTGIKRREKRKPKNANSHSDAIATQERQDSGLEPVPSPAGDLPQL